MKEGKNNDCFRLFDKKATYLKRWFNLKLKSHDNKEKCTMQFWYIFEKLFNKIENF